MVDTSVAGYNYQVIDTIIKTSDKQATCIAEIKVALCLNLHLELDLYAFCP